MSYFALNQRYVVVHQKDAEEIGQSCWAKMVQKQKTDVTED